MHLWRGWRCGRAYGGCEEGVGKAWGRRGEDVRRACGGCGERAWGEGVGRARRAEAHQPQVAREVLQQNRSVRAQVSGLVARCVRRTEHPEVVHPALRRARERVRLEPEGVRLADEEGHDEGRERQLVIPAGGDGVERPHEGECIIGDVERLEGKDEQRGHEHGEQDLPPHLLDHSPLPHRHDGLGIRKLRDDGPRRAHFHGARDDLVQLVDIWLVRLRRHPWPLRARTVLLWMELELDTSAAKSHSLTQRPVRPAAADHRGAARRASEQQRACQHQQRRWTHAAEVKMSRQVNSAD